MKKFDKEYSTQYYEFDYLENFMFDQLCKHGAIIEY